MDSESLEKSTSPRLVISARWVAGLTSEPTGYCMKELAARMKKADRLTAKATSQIVSRCTPRERRPQPKIQMPRKVDSMKNAASASIASGAPKMSPTMREYSDQFKPNWNS